MTENAVHDETLRLALSKGHLDWLEKERRDRCFALGLLLIVFVAALVWLGSAVMTPETSSNVVFVEAGESEAAIKELQADGYEVVFGSEAGQPAQPQDDDTGLLSLLETYDILVSICLALISGLFAARAFYELSRTNRWRQDHQAFLRERGHDLDIPGA